MQNLIETIIHYLVIVSIINIIMNGLPIPYLSNRLHQESFLINFSNRFEYQRKRECAGYATAFVLRHFGINIDGQTAYNEIPV